MVSVLDSLFEYEGCILKMLSGKQQSPWTILNTCTVHLVVLQAKCSYPHSHAGLPTIHSLIANKFYFTSCKQSIVGKSGNEVKMQTALVWITFQYHKGSGDSSDIYVNTKYSSAKLYCQTIGCGRQLMIIGACRVVWVPGQDLTTPHLMRNCGKCILSLVSTLYAIRTSVHA